MGLVLTSDHPTHHRLECPTCQARPGRSRRALSLNGVTACPTDHGVRMRGHGWVDTSHVEVLYM
jgi:hypothetical protein